MEKGGSRRTRRSLVGCDKKKREYRNSRELVAHSLESIREEEGRAYDRRTATKEGAREASLGDKSRAKRAFDDHLGQPAREMPRKKVAGSRTSVDRLELFYQPCSPQFYILARCNKAPSSFSFPSSSSFRLHRPFISSPPIQITQFHPRGISLFLHASTLDPVWFSSVSKLFEVSWNFTNVFTLSQCFAWSPISVKMMMMVFLRNDIHLPYLF